MGASWSGNYSSGHHFRPAMGSNTTNPLKYMPPGHFCPDVCGIEDFGEADTWRGRTVRGFFRLMGYWPKPGVR